MSETTGEMPQAEGFQLVARGEELIREGSDFTGRKHFLPALGNVQVFGTQAPRYVFNEAGITFKDGILAEDSAQNLQNQGLFDFGVNIGRLRELRSDLICTIILPNGMKLESRVVFDEDTQQQDPELRHNGDTGQWTRLNDPKEYILFLPDNSEFLSRCRFKFSQETPQKDK